MRRPAPILAFAVLAAVLGGGAALLARALPAVAEPSSGGPQDLSAVVERAEPGVVHIHNYLTRTRDVPEPGESGPLNDNVGSGFVYSSDGWIVTNRHVTEGAREILVSVKGRGWFRAALRGSDPIVDVSVLKIEATGLTPLPLGSPRTLRLGQWVIAAGSPYRLPRSFSVGIVSGLERSDVVNPGGYEDYIQTDAAINLGSSGGPLLDATGRVVGLNTAILSRSGGNQGIAFAVPIDVVAMVVEQLKAKGTVVRPTLGAVVRAASPLESLRLPGGGGLIVTRFGDESPARRAGLREGDVILGVDRVPTPSRGVLLRTLWARAAGQVVTLDVLRGAERLAVPVTLIER